MRLNVKKIYFFSGRGLCLISSLILCPFSASGESPSQKTHTIHAGTSEKDTPFWNDGLFTGGDSSIQQVIIKNIRYSIQPHHERMVIELSATQHGELAALTRPPLYQFFLDPKLNRLSLTFWGSPKLHFDPKKLHEMTQKSPLLSRLQLLPKLEEDLWTFGISMKKPIEVRVFELDSPTRIVIDIKKM